jgi:hypothetical protein
MKNAGTSKHPGMVDEKSQSRLKFCWINGDMHEVEDEALPDQNVQTVNDFFDGGM